MDWSGFFVGLAVLIGMTATVMFAAWVIVALGVAGALLVLLLTIPLWPAFIRGFARGWRKGWEQGKRKAEGPLP